MSAEFYNAAIPEPVAILGVRLRPFSLGHVLLLNRFSNAFGTGTSPAIEDLIQAIVICSQKYADALADMDNPKLPQIVAAWQRKLAPRNRLGFRSPGLGFSPGAEVGRFSEYVRAGSTFPLFTVKENHQGDATGLPMVQSVKVLLQSKMNFTEAEVLDRPWGLCLWDYFTLNSMEGHCKLMDRAEYTSARSNADKNHDRLVALMGRN